GPVVGQEHQLQLGDRNLTAALAGQPDALPAADGGQPGAQPVGVGQLVDVFQAAHPGELDDIGGVLGRQAVLAGQPPQQRLMLIAHLAPGQLVPGPDPAYQVLRVTASTAARGYFGIWAASAVLFPNSRQYLSSVPHGSTMIPGR